jgi:uncharacterized RDD family membrane protein YckC
MFISQVPILIPLFIIGVAVFLAVVPIAMDPSPKYLIAVFFILTGVMVYIPFVYYKKQPKIIGRLILKTQLSQLNTTNLSFCSTTYRVDPKINGGCTSG